MATFKKDDVVKAKAVIPQGPVEAMRMDEDGTIFYRISWEDISGETQTRWFAESNLQPA